MTLVWSDRISQMWFDESYIRHYITLQNNQKSNRINSFTMLNKKNAVFHNANSKSATNCAHI